MRTNLAEEDACLFHCGESILALCEKYGKSFCAACFRQGMARCLSPQNHCKFRSHCLVKEYNYWLEEARHQGHHKS